MPTGPVVRTTAWRDVRGAHLAADRLGGEVPDASVTFHDGLTVSGRPVPWWPDDGTDHVDAAAGVLALGRALAWRLGRWELRAAAIEALDPVAGEWRLRDEDAAG